MTVLATILLLILLGPPAVILSYWSCMEMLKLLQRFEHRKLGAKEEKR